MSKRKDQHPIDSLLHPDLMPSIWCPGCGIGIVVNTFLQTVKKLKIDPDKICVVSSGFGCTGKIPEYLKIKRLNIVDRNVFNSAADIKLENPDLKVVVFLNDSDFIASGVDDFLEACRNGTELLVIYINSFIYNVFVEHKAFRQMPFKRNPNNDDSASPFNIPHLAKTCGASFVARWTPLHCRRLSFSMKEAILKQGFSLIEIISPCLMYYASDGKLGETIDRMGMFYNNSVIKNDEPTENLKIKANEKIVLGRFVDSKD